MKEQVSFYRSLYRSDPGIKFEIKEENYPTLSEKDYELLNKPITQQEVYGAIMDMSRNKAPGPDGMPVEIYQLPVGRDWGSDVQSVRKSV